MYSVRVVAPLLLVLVVLAALASFTEPPSAVGIIPPPPPPPIAVLLIVDTPTYPGVNGDSKCSLDEAIWAADNNGVGDPTAGSCSANASHSLAVINFSLGSGTPTINMTSFTQTITAKVSINGNTGGASRVELHGTGTGSGDGLTIGGAGAAGSSIRNLVINGFPGYAVYVLNTSNITVAGNHIGTNADGTLAVPNRTGIFVESSSAYIGGTSGLTPGGPCTGDCNLISGNSSLGIYASTADGVIEGNFVGTDVTGTGALGNNYRGLFIEGLSSLLVGGTASGAGNLISGNATGLYIGVSAPTVQGNLIGTNASGTGAIPNTQRGIYVSQSSLGVDAIIGGSSPGAGNVASGNTGPGIEIDTATAGAIQGNLVGTQLDGTTPLGNTGPGIQLHDSDHNVLVGGTGSGQANVIAFNSGAGVQIDSTSYLNPVRGNSIDENGGKGIYLNGGNQMLAAPTVTSVDPIVGSACANCAVDVFSDASDEGKVYEGATVADGAGNWSFNGPLSGANVTATNTDSSHNTSEFSAPMALPATPTPTPMPSPSPSPTPTPSPTLAPTPTAGHTPSPTPTHTPTSSAILGDANCDGHVTDEDAVVILEESEGLTDSCAQTQALHRANDDTNCDGAVTPIDALDVLRHLAGLSELSLPAGCPEVGAALP